MAASGVAENLAVGFEWTPFAHGFVFWEHPKSEHLPPSDEAGQREGLEGLVAETTRYGPIERSDSPGWPTTRGAIDSRVTSIANR